VIFCMDNAQSEKERGWIEKKKMKAILGQTTLTHYMLDTQREKGWHEKLNNMAESRLQQPEPVAWRRRSGWGAWDTHL